MTNVERDQFITYTYRSYVQLDTELANTQTKLEGARTVSGSNWLVGVVNRRLGDLGTLEGDEKRLLKEMADKLDSIQSLLSNRPGIYPLVQILGEAYPNGGYHFEFETAIKVGDLIVPVRRSANFLRVRLSTAEDPSFEMIEGEENTPLLNLPEGYAVKIHSAIPGPMLLGSHSIVYAAWAPELPDAANAYFVRPISAGEVDNWTTSEKAAATFTGSDVLDPRTESLIAWNQTSSLEEIKGRPDDKVKPFIFTLTD